ncbi:MAG: FtsB family cell division protein [Verrucomicrobiales bacterium]
MSKKRSRSKITRLRAQTKAIRWVNAFVLCLFAVSVGALAVASALPQMRKLDEKEKELEKILAIEAEVIDEKEDARASYEGLRSDPELLELHAIDRLNVYRPGESIYRMERGR